MGLINGESCAPCRGPNNWCWCHTSLTWDKCVMCDSVTYWTKRMGRLRINVLFLKRFSKDQWSNHNPFFCLEKSIWQSKSSWTRSHPNDNNNPNSKTAKTVVGLGLIKLWESPPPKGTQNYMAELELGHTQKTKA